MRWARAAVGLGTAAVVGCSLPSMFTGRPAGDSGTGLDSGGSDAMPPGTDAAPDSGPGTDAVPGADSGVDSGTGTDALPAGTDAAPACTVGALQCATDDLQQCMGPSGAEAWVTLQTCALGCSLTAGAHCLALVPSNGIPTAYLSEGTLAWDTGADVLDDYEWDASTGSIRGRVGAGSFMVVRGTGPGLVAGIGFHTVVQGGGSPDIAVWTFASVNLAAGETHRFVASTYTGGTLPSPAVAIVSGGAATINADLVLNATVSSGGGGTNAWFPATGGWQGGIWAVDVGNLAGHGAGPGGGVGFGVNCDAGGSGAGYGAAGGTGGSSPDGLCAGAGATPAGASNGTPAVVPLQGGSGGGAGGADMVIYSGRGGGGGGAIQIVSGAGISVGGTIWAAGGGGEASPDDDGSGGGGAGGAVLLEGATVTVTALAVIACNGGGGASGALGAGGAGNPGSNGLLSAMAAAGGPSLDGNATSGAGGAGGAGASVGGGAGTGSTNGGGGGGAAGRIRFNTRTGAATSSGTVSPFATAGVVTTL
jgi:hypothetical protein